MATQTREIINSFLLRLVKLLNVVLVTLPFIYVWYELYGSEILNPFKRRGNWLIIVSFVLLYILITHTYDGFLINIAHVTDIVYSQFLALVITNVAMYIVISLLSKRLVSPHWLLLMFFVQLSICVLWAILANKWYYSFFPPKRTAIIYDKRKGMEELIDEYGLNRKYDIQKVLHIGDCVNSPNILNGCQTVFLSGIHSTDRNVVIKYCIEHNITALVIPRVGDLIMSSASRMHIFHLPILRVNRYKPTLEYSLIKRLLDIVLSIAALIVFSPIVLITAIAIAIDDGRPIFYKQARLTKDGKVFNIIKFRSMKKDAEKEVGAILSSGEKDARITRVGRVIRRVRIDEIPQLVNIIKGDMTIVGPRPERPEIAALIEKRLPEFRLRLQMKAGLTGYAQVYGKYNSAPYDKLQMDLMYIANATIFEDIKIILATIKILFQLESTEGIDPLAGIEDLMEIDSETERIEPIVGPTPASTSAQPSN